DGLHLKGEAYLWWKHLLYPYVFNLGEKVSLLPMPEKLTWTHELFPLYACRTISVTDTCFAKQAEQLHTILAKMGIITSTGSASPDLPYILLQKDPSLASAEAYRIIVREGYMLLQAAEPHGMFNALQTLRQLMRDAVMVNGCIIEDKPAFSWRGYMVDVGRNYQSVGQLKQQIEVMSRYKLNVFHLHLTEDIAWRLDSRIYPQLLYPENMLRDKGKYYTEADIKELMAYCQARFISFVPEIDMPGHSGAFSRCFGKEMQSDSGMTILRNIIREICSTYHFSYWHIGGDEVKITNPHFLPDMISFIQSKSGSKVIGWLPGGNLPAGVIRQLWQGGSKSSDTQTGVNIDSRCLYINHMDPLESVVTIFNRRIGDRMRADSHVIGGTLCVWNDRRLNNEQDILRMNPVYPAMLAFAEKSWCGGGQAVFTTEIGAPASPEADAFTEFEQRLIDLRKLYFKNLPFPYEPQSGLVWKLYGPYLNQGQLTAKFPPEKASFLPVTPVLMRVGGTIILRHWWFPLVTGAISAPQEHTTWYAATQLYAEEDGVRNCWIGFNNLSRSTATIGPAAGTWDNRHSAIWINGEPVSPPDWQQAGQKISLEVPLTDEGYEYRQPTPILLHKGWNQILVKLPVGSFKGGDWQNPVKWMFTFLPLPE
ncbi:MAG TPA: family 20 glycosylhydrolase, partial [Sediminibacterium sp.]|nr:family 20 glycosylhydrolase [Sediminibacterium sp.]